MAMFPINNRILTYFSPSETVVSGEHVITLSDTVFGFLDEGFEGSSIESIGENAYVEKGNDEDDDDEENENVEDQGFWENQHQILEATLYRTTSLESRIRQATKEALKEVQQSTNVCVCRRPVDGCRSCLMTVVCNHLQAAGFNASICKSKWRSSPDIPSGEHTFLEVLDNSNPRKGEVRIIIELNLRAEFEMARASDEYNKLVKRLPEVFVGKIERLLSIIKIICPAAKKCMKEKKMHMGPWRKLRYMQAKWLKTSERISSKPVDDIPSNAYFSGQISARPRASMLTVDLLGNFSNSHRPMTVAVV
ncbi:hypothetical protein LIER_13054 [Lithospermum erythrorhizon]|uniref:Uncharacterized protein n=1 Tax=Lithospermum erythrorhizon TaxID=34254 RepID=A0AAV3PW63_LITER